MKMPFFCFALCAIVCLIHTHFNRVGASPLPPAGDYKPENRHYARTFATNLSVGEPRTVRMIYFLPNDRQPQPHLIERLKEEIQVIQRFYAHQMQIHGYGYITFNVESDGQGNPVVHHVDGKHSDSYYLDKYHEAAKEVKEVFDISSNIYIIAIDNSSEQIGREAGVAGKDYALIPAGIKWDAHFHESVTAHELGHVFGLHHDFRNPAYIMSYGLSYENIRNRISRCSAKFLSIHPYFNINTPLYSDNLPIVEAKAPSTYSSKASHIPIEIEASDSKGLHQIIITVWRGGPFEVKQCYELQGEKNVNLTFDYDGIIPSDVLSSFSNTHSYSILIKAVNINANIESTLINITQIKEDAEQIDSDIEINIPDKGLRASIEKELDKTQNEPIYASEMKQLTELYAGGASINDLTGIASACNLRVLTLWENDIVDISHISGLKELVVLSLQNNNISEISLSGLDNLIRLNIGNNLIEDISVLPELPRLRSISLYHNNIRDISGLASLSQLERVSLDNNSIVDISPLTGLSQLISLQIDNNSIVDISPLAGLTQLQELDISYNSISNISALSDLMNMAVLNLSGQSISDISPLAGLTYLRVLQLNENMIADISPLANLVSLTHLSIYRNDSSEFNGVAAVSDISILAGLTSLTELHMSGNDISDISVLTGLTYLNQFRVKP